jgi:hypothetical protein
MFLRFYKEESPINLLSILILLLLLWFIPHSSFPIVEAEPHSVFFRLWGDYFKEYAAFFSWIGFFLMVSQSFILYKLSQVLKVFPSRMILPLFIFVLLLNLSPALTNFNPYVLASFFFLWGTLSFFKAYEKDKAYQQIFNTGLLYALAAFCFSFYAVFFIAVILGFIFFGMAKWRNFIIFILGFSFPFLLFLSYYFLFDNTALLFQAIYPEEKSKLFYILQFDGVFSFVRFVFFVLFAAFAYFKVWGAKSERTLVQIKIQSIVLYLLFFSIFITMLEGVSYAVVYVIMAPMLSMVFTLYIMHTKNKLLGNILFFILLLLSIFERLNILL